MFDQQSLLWIGFIVFVFLMLALDLGVFNRKAHVIKIKEALILSIFWISLAIIFNIGIYFLFGPQKALDFLTGYVIEKALSVDNLFVFLMIFSYFHVPSIYQHKILFWGILGALVMRAIFIAAGITLIEEFHAIIYIFGAFLIITGIKMAFQGDKKIEPEKNPLLRYFRRVMPVTESYEEDKFFVKRAGKYFATPLFIVLLVVESTDLLFAVDSIPAVLAITTDAFIVYTSNVFAILGLRALYFALAGVMPMFYYLNYGLSAILTFVGTKMLISDYYKVPTMVSLGVVAGILIAAVIFSVVRARMLEYRAKELKRFQDRK
ncbi:MAG: TerC family protein [Candidatus Methanoperedens sp.]|nr:TerC family protein [Candidatus Methanoperedens sp.]